MTDWRCSACLAPAQLVTPSLDPDHPFGICSAVTGPYKRPAHGGHLVPLTGDSAEQSDIWRAHQAQHERELHVKHLTTRLVRSCRLCNEAQDAMFRARGDRAPA